MSGFLIGLLIAFIIAKNSGPQTDLLFPPLTNCAQISSIFATEELFLEYAIKDKESTFDQESKGHYMCYCGQYSTYKIIYDGERENICYEYQFDIIYSAAFKQVIAFAVVFFNYIIQRINMFLVRKIGFHKHSEETLRICKQLFFA